MISRSIHEQNAEDIQAAIEYEWSAKRKRAAGDLAGAARDMRLHRMVRRMMRGRIRAQRALTAR